MQRPLTPMLIFLGALISLAPPAAPAEIDDQRRALIQKLINAGVFSKLEQPGSLPHIWTGGNFHALSFDDKQSFLSVVYAYVYCAGEDRCTADHGHAGNLVVIRDYYTGRRIGTYSPLTGGLDLK